MQITRAGEYGVLGMIHLARCAPGQAAIEEVSQKEEIPKSFLAKIFQYLVKAGLVHSVRGAGGGFVLSRPATEITILQIIEAIEGKITLQRCLESQPDCDHMGRGCALCDIFGKAQDEMREVLKQTTLADILDKQNSIVSSKKPV